MKVRYGDENHNQICNTLFVPAGHGDLVLWGETRSGKVHAPGNVWYINVKADHHGQSLLFFFLGRWGGCMH